jgi:hypothetical protein
MRNFGVHQRAERLGRATPRIDADLGKRVVAHLVGLDCSVDGSIELPNHRRRRSGLHQDTGPVLTCELRVAGLDGGRHIFERSQPAGPNEKAHAKREREAPQATAGAKATKPSVPEQTTDSVTQTEANLFRRRARKNLPTANVP